MHHHPAFIALRTDVMSHLKTKQRYDKVAVHDRYLLAIAFFWQSALS